MTFKKVNNRGFSHDIVMVLVVVICAIIGVGYLVLTHAAASYATVAVKSSGQCLNVTGNSTTEGANIIQWPCSTSAANEQIGLVPAATSGYYNMAVKSSGQCLNVSGNSTAQGANIIQWPCSTSATNEEFKLVPAATSGYYNLAVQSSGQCLNVSGNSTAQGANIIQWPCSTTATNEEWAGTALSPSSSSTTTGTSGTTSSGTTGSSGSGSTTTGSTGSTTSGGCTSGGVVAPCIGSATTGASGWGKPIFDDEFSQDSSLNTKEWVPYWFSDGGQGDYAKNVSVSNGYLNLYDNPSSGGATVTTNPDGGASPGFQFTYGYVEARIYVPGNSSGQIYNWPSFWLDGQNWPTDGELDVFEGLSGQACAHWHGPTGDGTGYGLNGGDGCVSGNFTGWHTFAADWESGIVKWYYDGTYVGCVETSGSDCGGSSHDSQITGSPMYPILVNGGTSGPSATSTMQVQYVRVWQ